MSHETGRIDKGGIFLTFDDVYVTEWREAMHIVQEFDARATFFVSQFHTLSPEQIDTLIGFKKAGHTIGCHSVNHEKPVDYIERFGVERYLDDEIYPAVDAMRKAGLEPRVFSYPCSQRDERTDQVLAQVFHRLRSGAGVPEGKHLAEVDEFFVPVDKLSERICLTGRGIDGFDADDVSELDETFSRARDRSECIVFYAHNISDRGSSHYITPQALEAILEVASLHRLSFYTFDQL